MPAGDLLRALAAGKGLDLAGVVVDGDLVLDELPTQKVSAVGDLAPEDRRVLEGLSDEEVHVIRGPFVIKHSRVKGRIVNRLKRGFLLITGPVVLAHTTSGYQITKNFNKCMDCHAFQKAKAAGATKVSVTHFRTREGQELDNISPRRYFCTQCHVAQTDAKPLVENTFKRSRGLQ